MSIQTVEIALPTGIDSVSVGLAEPISIVEVRQGAGGEPGAAGATGPAGPNTVTTATTTNLTGFISGNGTNISGATAAATAATANTLVLRSAGGGASFAGLNTNSGSYAQIGGENFNVATTSNANLTTTGSGTVIVSGAGGTTIGGGTLTFSPSGFTYGTGAASAHRTALGLGSADDVGFRTVTLGTAAVASNRATIGSDGAGKLLINSSASQGASCYGSLTIQSSGHLQMVSGAAQSFLHGPSGGAGGNTFEQRNGTAQQESRIYGTYTGPGNYRRLALKMSTAGVAQIVAEGGGSGASGNRIEIDGLRIGKGGSNVASNTALGASALNDNTTGGNNCAVGRDALRSNETGSFNSAVGREALANNTTGNNNSAVGHQALRENTTSGNNSAVGREALRENTTGGNNSAVGREAGRYIEDGTTANAITNNSVYLGANTKALASNQTNQIVIGHNAIGLGSNTAVLGNDSIVTTALKGDVGIGTTSPASKLDVVGNITASASVSTAVGFTCGTGAPADGAIGQVQIYSSSVQKFAATTAGANLFDAGKIKWSSTSSSQGAASLGISATAVNSGILEVNNGTVGTLRDLSLRNFTASGTIQTGGYTFSTLPSPTTGMRAYITDGAASPVYMDNAAGGGTTVTPVFYDGSNWINA